MRGQVGACTYNTKSTSCSYFTILEGPLTNSWCFTKLFAPMFDLFSGNTNSVSYHFCLCETSTTVVRYCLSNCAWQMSQCIIVSSNEIHRFSMYSSSFGYGSVNRQSCKINILGTKCLARWGNYHRGRVYQWACKIDIILIVLYDLQAPWIAVWYRIII